MRFDSCYLKYYCYIVYVELLLELWLWSFFRAFGLNIVLGLKHLQSDQEHASDLYTINVTHITSKGESN